MPYAIHLLFDRKTTTAIRSVWKQLAVENIAPYMHESGDQPHISLAIYEDLHQADGKRHLKNLAENTTPFESTFSHIGIFTRPKTVIFLAPTLTTKMVRLHNRTHELFSRCTTSPWEHYLPEHWVPHCTLAMELKDKSTNAVIDVARQIDLPLSAQATGIEVIEFRPVQHLSSYSLGYRNE